MICTFIKKRGQTKVECVSRRWRDNNDCGEYPLEEVRPKRSVERLRRRPKLGEGQDTLSMSNDEWWM